MKVASVHRGLFARFIVALILVLAVPTAHLSAQTVTGTIIGTILDSSGSAVPNATVTVTNQDTGVVRTAESPSEGLYTVPSLLPGKYTVI